jgi:hypothetical protein
MRPALIVGDDSVDDQRVAGHEGCNDGWTQTGRITSLTIPNSVTEFGGYLLGEKASPAWCLHPNSPLTTLPELAFRSMDGLTSVTLPDRT